MNALIKDALKLVIITVVAGLVLGAVFYKYIKYKVSDTCNDQTDPQCL